MALKMRTMLVVGLMIGLMTAPARADESSPFKTPNDKISYGVGVDIARNLKQQEAEVDIDQMAKGFTDVLSEEKLAVTEDSLHSNITAFYVEQTWKEGQARKAPANVSYAVGVDAGRYLKRFGFKIEAGLAAKGLKDALSGQRLAMTEEELRSAMLPFQGKLRQTRMTAMRLPMEESAKERALRTDNLKKEGVVTLPSGLQYRVLKAGDGKAPTNADTVEIRYRGAFVDGNEFSRSPRDGQPIILKVSKAIPGWNEALKLMQPGSKWQVFVPPRLAYKTGGWGYIAGSNETLVFELELVAIKVTGVNTNPAPPGTPAGKPGGMTGEAAPGPKAGGE
jgi:FKBP-type peptidyl-prolyl cis-trans isomerase